MKLTQSRLTIDASPAEVWSLLSALDQIHTWSPDVSRPTITTRETEGVGAARQLRISSFTLLERVTVWEPEQTLAYTIEDLPSIVITAHNRWTLDPVPEGTRVTLTNTLTLSNTFRFLEGRVQKRMQAQLDALIAALAYHFHKQHTRISA